jgi:choline dehydrogenase-like flavoprotein
MNSPDVVIVGSGPTGGYAAKTLAEAGAHVLVLDAGRSALEQTTLAWTDQMRRRLGYRIEEDPAAIRRQRVQSACYAWTTDPHAFVDDGDLPYVTDGTDPFAWLRCRRIGGRMTVRRHGLQFYRLSDFDLKAGARDGASDSWPLSYRDLEPYYERVERWMQLQGTVEHLPQLPDGVLSHTVIPNAGLRALDAALQKRWRNRRVIPGRTAAPPVPIHDAMRAGRCRLRTNAIVTKVITDGRTGRVAGVRFVDRWAGTDREVKSRVVVLCASAIESARLLLASASPQHPEGLGNSSGLVGRYLSDHAHVTGINADMPVRVSDGPDMVSWGYMPQFRNVCGMSERFVRGYGIQVFTGGTQCGLVVFGEMLPHRDNRVTLDPVRKDRWGVPLARIACVHGDNERTMMRDAVEQCREMLDAAGFKIWRLNTEMSRPGLASHEVGTARMGCDPRDSVLNQFCQNWDAPNLFVMDGACFVTQGAQNPTLTMMALAARSSDYLLEQMKAGNL